MFKHLAFRVSKGLTGAGGVVKKTTSNDDDDDNSNVDDGQESHLLLVAILRRLAYRWSVQTSLHTNVLIPVETKTEELSWQSLEGRLLVYELLVGYLLVNHRNFLTVDSAVAAAGAGAGGRSGGSPASSRRTSSMGSAVGRGESRQRPISPSSEGSEGSSDSLGGGGLGAVGGGGSSGKQHENVSTPVRSTGGRRGYGNTPNDIMSPDPTTSSPALALSTAEKSARSGRSLPSSVRSSLSCGGGPPSIRTTDVPLHSILTTLQRASGVQLDVTSIFWDVDGGEGEGEKRGKGGERRKRSRRGTRDHGDGRIWTGAADDAPPDKRVPGIQAF